MPEYLSPGVYVDEVPRGVPPAIDAAPTDVTAFLGEAERGPVWPTAVAGLADYARWFGAGGGWLPAAVKGFFENGGRRLVVARLARASARTSGRTFGGLRVDASGPGSWGHRVFVDVKAEDAAATRFTVRAAYWTVKPTRRFNPFDDARTLPRPQHMEVLGGVSPAALAADEDVYAGVMTLVSLRVAATAAVKAGAGYLTGGASGSGAIGRAEVDGPADGSSGLAALAQAEFDGVSLVAAPGFTDTGVADALIAHCGAARYRFAILDGPASLTRVTAPRLDPRAAHDTRNAAYYAPWLEVIGPDGGRVMVPPSGHVAGIYAKTDAERGVAKAPANLAPVGITGVAYAFSTGEQEVLNPRGVNLIRAFPGRGTLVWGARTLSTDPEWKYVNLRRLMLFLEASLDRGLQWVVFEPNGEALWAKVRAAAETFLNAQWRAGAFQGVTQDEAFFVRCDRTTMTQADIDAGRLICVIGVAPLKPAEFVIFRLGWPSSGG